MKITYDFLILNNCPSFYKINLYNEINLHAKIFVIFLGLSDQVVIDKNFKQNIKFDYILVNDFQVENRCFFKTFQSIIKNIDGKIFRKVIYGGYIEKEFLLLSFLFPKRRNILQSESALESTTQGVKGKLKKYILKRYSKAIVSGKIHAEVLHRLSYKGKVYISGSVGIFRKNFERLEKVDNENLKFLYVGRLLEKKNVRLLIEVFNANNLPLTIVGEGSIKDELEKIAKSNINFLGFCPNNEIHNIYKQHEIFILPSFIEPWGLVVEEALYNNCVLILSDKVGSLHEMLINIKSGVSFNPYSSDSLSKAIDEVVENYHFFYKNVKNIDFTINDRKQVREYIKLLHD